MRKCKVIIYSSCNLLLTYLGQSLMPSCHVIHHTTSTQQTISLSKEINPDLIILISTTPLINGSDLIRQLRPKTTHHPQIYVISWQLSEQVVLGLLEMGVDQYMTFPISVERLKNKIITINHMLNI